MAATTYNTTGAWSSSARYTAAADVDVLLSNPGRGLLRFTFTTSDAAPSIDVNFASVIQPQESLPMQLLSGDRLWMAGGAVATLEV